MSKSLEDLLSEIHATLAKDLLKRLKRKEGPTPQELNVIRQFLKDNGIDSADLHLGKGPVQDLATLVPFPEQPIRKTGGE